MRESILTIPISEILEPRDGCPICRMRDMLEQRTVELGDYDGTADVYQILSGLTEDDFVAFPDEELCKVGAPTTKTEQGGTKNS